MIKILYISYSLKQNGTEMFMMNILRHIDRNKFHIDFCIYNDEITSNRLEAESYGCNIYVLPSRRDNFIKSVFKTLLFFRNHAHDYQAIHWNGGNLSSIFTLVLSWIYRVPIRIVHAHSSSAVGIHNILLHKFHRLLIPIICNRYLACSSEASRFFFPSVKSTLIKNGIDVKKFAYNKNVRDEVRNELGLDDRCRVLGHVGRFDDNKNQTFLLDIFEVYLHNDQDSYLILVGQGETLELIKDRTKELGIEKRVLFLGLRNDVNRILQAMDCFIMPSKFEGLPFVLVEAQCSGLYCVVSDTINHDVKLTDNLVFLSLKSGEHEWSNIINGALEHYSRSSQSKLLIEKGYSIEETVNYLKNIYENQ